jgi:hypothetical protein
MVQIATAFVAVLSLSTAAIFFLHLAFSTREEIAARSNSEHQELLDLISRHNDTLHKIIAAGRLRHMSSDELVEVISGKDKELKKLTADVQALQTSLSLKTAEISRLSDLSSSQAKKIDSAACPISSASSENNSPAAALTFPAPMSSMERECDMRYGNGLLQSWAASREVWCEAGYSSPTPADVVCYPYHQQHKKLDGRPADIFCEARNLFVDFSKVRAPYS